LKTSKIKIYFDERQNVALPNNQDTSTTNVEIRFQKALIQKEIYHSLQERVSDSDSPTSNAFALFSLEILLTAMQGALDLINQTTSHA